MSRVFEMIKEYLIFVKEFLMGESVLRNIILALVAFSFLTFTFKGISLAIILTILITLIEFLRDKEKTPEIKAFIYALLTIAGWVCAIFDPNTTFYSLFTSITFILFIYTMIKYRLIQYSEVHAGH